MQAPAHCATDRMPEHTGSGHHFRLPPRGCRRLACDGAAYKLLATPIFTGPDRPDCVSSLAHSAYMSKTQMCVAG
eukprot:7389331-Prymnesium_polylepis.1